MAAQQAPSHVAKTRLVFSDLDGTLIHYGDVLGGVSEGEIIRCAGFADLGVPRAHM